MPELLIATRNIGKVREIKELLKGSDYKVTSLLDYSRMPEVEETGRTFAANAILKAASIAQFTKKLTVGEDSGLEVKALGNQPGVYSARYAGKNKNDQKNNAKLVHALKKVSPNKRQARYRCCMALADGKRVIGVVNGSCGGMITTRAKGKNGFGYDPLFLIPKYGKTFGELDPTIKAKMSHRARALAKLQKLLKSYTK